MAQDRLKAVRARLELPVAFLAVLVVPALVIEERAASPELQLAAHAINWVVWIAFCLEFVVLWLAEPRWRTVRKAWFDLLLIVLSPPFLASAYFQATRSLRATRLMRLVRLARVGAVTSVGLALSRRLLSHRKFYLVALAAIGVVSLGAFGIFIIEGDSNPSVRSFGDALWWSVVTATTVGYGDVSPTTTEGRVIAVMLMLTGIGVIGVFTATVASLFLQPESAPAQADLSARLDAIEQKLDRLLKRDDRGAP